MNHAKNMVNTSKKKRYLFGKIVALPVALGACYSILYGVLCLMFPIVWLYIITGVLTICCGIFLFYAASKIYCGVENTMIFIYAVVAGSLIFIFLTGEGYLAKQFVFLMWYMIILSGLGLVH